MEKAKVLKILAEIRQESLLKIEEADTPQGYLKSKYNLGINNMYYAAVKKIATYKEGEE